MTDIPNVFAHSRKPRALIAALALGTALGAAGTGWLLSSQPSMAAISAPLSVTPASPQPGFSQLVARVKPAVVQIATVSRQSDDGQAQAMQQMPDLPAPFGDMLRQFRGNGGGAMPEQHALGSGFIVDPAGYIVTNNHVVDGAHDISVTLGDGNKYVAKVIGRDQKTDLALLK